VNGSIRRKMKILIVGSGGREHAIIWALKHTASGPLKLFCAPGNAGIGRDAELVTIIPNNQAELLAFARSENIDLTFVGPEAPLADGLVDSFEEAGLNIVGPSLMAARLEGSKAFAKEFMAKHGIPTADFRIADSADEALMHLRKGDLGAPDSSVVIKADGLAAGKGVVVAASRSEAETAVEDLMVRGIAGAEAGKRLVLEQTLQGREVSLLLFTDGTSYALMPPARDHKRIGEHDTGPNTGGMGTITEESLLSPALLDTIVHSIVEPTLEGARRAGFKFKGVLFLGLMLTSDGPKVLEYNVRFGDPETQAILVRLKTDLLSIFEAIRTEKLSDLRVEWHPGASACVVLASEGYPGKYEAGAIINGLESFDSNSVQIFHAGTGLSADGRRFTTNGGRVLGVTASAADLRSALQQCYGAIDRINWPGMQFRRDIGSSALVA
jgi:phosphoribosylamine--glycine ligase